MTKDWAISAAVDIIDHVKTGSTLEWVAERIHAHSPFKPFVAYMPVPRCEMCAHFMPWDRPDAKVKTGTDRGDCRKFNGYLNGIRQSFGCVEWKEK